MPSTGQEAGPSLLYGSSPSHRCLVSYQSLRGRATETKVKTTPPTTRRYRQHQTRSGTSDLDGVVLRHHAVPGCEVSVDKLFSVEVGHAVGDFCSHLEHVFQSRRWGTRRVVLQTTNRLDPLTASRRQRCAGHLLKYSGIVFSHVTDSLRWRAKCYCTTTWINYPWRGNEDSDPYSAPTSQLLSGILVKLKDVRRIGGVQRWGGWSSGGSLNDTHPYCQLEGWWLDSQSACPISLGNSPIHRRVNVS